MKNTLLALVVGALLLTPLLPAQAGLPVTLTGTIQKAPAGACNPQATHQIACTDVLLMSQVVDLSQYEGRTVALTGDLAPQLNCISIDVQTVENATARTIELALFGHRLGRSITFTTLTPPGSFVVYTFSCGSGFLPLGPLGTLLIDLQESVIVGTTLSIGFALRTETIPQEPALVGAKIHYQFAYVALATGLEVGFLNPGCFTIQK